MLRADCTASRSAASESICGRGAPARTAIATSERTRSTLLAATTRPAPISLSIASDASTTTSNGSPACTRLAASTPPTDSISTTQPERCSNAPTRSARTWRVAIDEMPVIFGVISA